MTLPAEPALFRAHPELAQRIPWLPLGKFPTRVQRVDHLLPPSVELWVKHEDESGELYGGNKVRKLEFLLAQARAYGATRLGTIGGIGSHHVLATAVYGRRAGFEVEAVVFPQPLNDHVREQLLADVAAGAKLRATAGLAGVPWAVWAVRRRPATAWIAGGGSSVTGTIGFISAGCELKEQLQAGELPRMDAVYGAIGSCGTIAGLLVGLAGEDAPEVVGVRVVDRVVCNASKTLRLAGAARFALLPPNTRARFGPLAPLRVEHRFFGGAYGRSTPEADAAVAAAAAVGLRLEPTYTGKAMAALLADARSGRLNGKRVLFLHTYSGADLSPLLASGPGPSALPPLLQQHFAADHPSTSP